MNGEEAYALSKALTAQAAAGLKNYQLSDTGLLTMETSDGRVLSYQFREPEDGVSITSVATEGTQSTGYYLVITYSDSHVDRVGPIPTVQGPKGDDGKSAYEIAVEKGFPGTEEEWLESLKGADGKSAYEIAVEEGFPGTEEEWLKSLKGEDGFSPTIVVKESTDTRYVLTITTKDDSYDTPNLKGSGGGSDEELTPEQVESLINLL